MGKDLNQKMNKNQEFIFNKVKYGLANKQINLLNVRRLLWNADDYNKVPWKEWKEWSRRTHWALQVAFIHDTNKMQDKKND